MPDPTPGANPQTPPSRSQQSSDSHRNAWILTAYGIFGLGLLCAIAYALAQYAVR